MSLSTQILLSLGLGAAAGIFFGEWMQPLAVVGDIFVRLLQMTVLPYVVVSLVSGLGRLDYADAKRLGVWFLGLLALLWVAAFAMVALMPVAFPPLSRGAFFSTTLVQPAAELDFIGLYVPTNPFHALANNVVPAVVLFSVTLGVALIGIREKSALLETFDSIGSALLRVSIFIVKLTPVGVFAISASAAGTMTIEEFSRVQVYLVSYIVLSLICTFWLLPGLISALTPLRASEVLRLSKDALVTAFATGSSFVVIPILAANSKTLLGTDARHESRTDSLVDVIIPASHNFPHTAKVLTLSFILFAGWFDDSPVPLSDYPFLFAAGVASTFASVAIAIPFLLDLMELPHDLFQLFVATGVLNARFGTLLQAMHMLALTLLVSCALTGRLRVRPRRLLVFAGTTAITVGAAILCMRLLFSLTVDSTNTKADILYRMPLLFPPVATVERSPDELSRSAPDTGSRLDSIRTRGTLRVCFQRGIPFAYLGSDGKPRGFDLEMAGRLAEGLDVTIEWIKLEPGSYIEIIAAPLNEGICDIAMGRAAITMDAVGRLAYARPHLEMNMGFLVPDHERRDFVDLAAVQAREGLRFAFPDSRYYLQRYERYFPNAEFIPVADAGEYIEDGGERFDAMIYPLEIASAWSLQYPDYGVVMPRSGTEKMPLAYMLPLDEPEWQNAVDTWVSLLRSNGEIDALHAHWILGRTPPDGRPRWSVLRDVLGWTD